MIKDCRHRRRRPHGPAHHRRLTKEADGLTVSGALERPRHELVGAGCRARSPAAAPWTSPSPTTWTRPCGQCDVLIDFTSPKVTLKNLEVCARLGKAIVIGSTGFTPEERALAGRTSPRRSRWCCAPNMSVGVNVCFKVLKDVAKIPR